jgi:molybdate transport system regulatory protein
MKRPTVVFRIDFGHGQAIGPGKIALLEEIERGYSLSQAARNLNISYRRAWDLFENLNACFVAPVTVSSIGGRGSGGTKLTSFGRRVTGVCRDLDGEIQRRAAVALQSLSSRTRNRSAR